MNKNNKAALITGGAKRIGKAFSLALAEQGFDIALHFHSSEDAASETASAITDTGRRCELFQCDLTKMDVIQSLISDVFTCFPQCVLLINNASVFQRRTFTETTPEFLELMLQVHLKAPFFLSQAFARLCKKGLIVNMADTKVTKSAEQFFPYTLSKKILVEFTRMSAKVLGPEIRVNAIAPGIILPSSETSEAELNTMRLRMPLQEKGNPAHLVSALNYLIHNEFVTGECLFVDGGEHL